MKRLIKKANYKTLIVVDVQKEFAHTFDEEYLNSIESLVNGDWDKIFVVVDMNEGEANIPRFLKNAADEILYKTYGFDFEYLRELDEDNQIVEIEEDEVYRYGEELVVRGNTHEWFNVPEDMELCFKELQSAKIVGGADSECLDDVENALSYLGVDVVRDNSYIYGYRNDVDTEYIDYVDWVSV